jgi:Na+/proline symporter
MGPEFLAILEEREQLGRWIILLPICLGFLALIVSAAKSRKDIAFVYIALLAIASVAIPMIMSGLWWDELNDVATSHEEKEWIFNHDGGGLVVAPLFAALLAAVFWIIAVLVLSIRIVIARTRKTKEKQSAILSPRNHPNNRMQPDAAKLRR